MKRVIILLLMFTTGSAISQKNKKYELNDDQRAELLKAIPTKDDKVLYDYIVKTDSTVSKEQMFIRIRQWFVENFTDSKNVLEVNDKENGLLTGKGTYKYSKVNGLNFHEGYTTFIINVAIKEGKFRYQLYSFTAEGTNKSMLSNTNQGYKEKISLDDMVQWYKNGKREKYARKYLDDMIGLVYFVNMSLRDLAASGSSIADF